MEGTSLHDVGWPHAGEIDIAELIGVWPTKVLRNVHVGRPAGAGAVQWGWQQPHASTVFDPASPHVYGVYFDANEVRFYLDRSLVQTISRTDVAGVGGTWPFGEPQFLILNVAVGSLGGEPAAGTWPQTMTVGPVSIYPQGSRTPRLL
jgi:beta-glucanase (GH16 family)